MKKIVIRKKIVIMLIMATCICSCMRNEKSNTDIHTWEVVNKEVENDNKDVWDTLKQTIITMRISAIPSQHFGGYPATI